MTTLRQHKGNGQPVDMRGGLGVYVWGERGLLASLDAARDELDAIRPAIIVLHASPSSLVANIRVAVSRVRQRHPYARVWVGCGIDGTAGEWREARRTDAQVIAPLRDVAMLCEALAIECVVWNGESQWKDQPHDKVTPAEIEALADACGRAVVKAAPNVVHWLSSFDQPNLHGSLRAFLRGFTRWVSAYTGQAYVAVAGGAPRGALDHRLDAAARGQELAERAGYLPDDATGVDTADDVDRVPTIQGHATHLADLARAAAELPMVLVWSVPLVSEGGRVDETGLRALRFASRVRDSGLSVIEWQRAKGLVADGVVGPRTLAAAGVEVAS
jgi:hypothetical protein